MQVELVGPEAIDEVMPDWEALHEADPCATPFQAPGWGRAWLAHWAPDAVPWMLRVRATDRVVGLAPLALRRRGPLRMLEMLGKEPGDYWDILAEPSQRQAVTAAVVGEIGRRRREWDAWIVNCMPEGSPTGVELLGSGLRVLERSAIACPAIELPETFEEYLAGVPAQRRGNLRRHLRRLDEGDLELSEVRGDAELERAVARWQELRVRQWGERDMELNPVHAEPRFAAFMLAALQALVPRELAIVTEFRRAGQVLGVYINLIDSRAYYWYLGGFEPQAASLGLGKIAIADGIRSSIAIGRRYFDFTRGPEKYKYWYGAIDSHVPSLVVGHGGLRSRAALAAAHVVSARRARTS